MYKKVSTGLNFVEREHETLKFWNENKIFEKSMTLDGPRPTYTFYDGPPTANGKPHIGHVLTRVIKDMIPRYHTMKGAFVPRKAGWDTHGLPVEIEVEKILGLDGKDQIESYGLAPFIDKCKESVWKYKGMWEDFSQTVGFWADMDDPYITYDNKYIESEWWALKEIWNKGLLYKGFKVVPYCPRCGTPLSAQEVAQGYKTVKERSAIARFKAKGEDTYYLVWTTTPWSLPSNVALCVNPGDTYCKVQAADGYTYILAEALLDTVLGKLKTDDAPAYEIIEKFIGTDLEGKEYEPLYECAGIAAEKQHKKAHFVTCDNYVTMSDGTGIVHIAPAFGEDDSRIGRNYDLPFVQFVDGKGNLTPDTPYGGIFVKKADPIILEDLKNSGKLYEAPKFEHEYPHCWRCDTPLIYYARESWYIKETAVRDDLIRNNNTVNWIPESIGKGRFGNWLENIQDWAISRNRYWGTPLNIWECECGHKHCVGSVAELKEMSDNCPDEPELHRPYIDEVTIKCPECGGVMHRVPEVLDCWFDSGSMPFAQHHYPFENKELFEDQFPADFISEAVDQPRGWFHSLMAISTLLFNKAPYKNVIVLGHVQDEKGQKMSKSKGNAVDPFDALNTYGADAIRWYFYTNSAPWLPSKFSGKAVVEGQRKFMGTLWNTYAFWVLYADIDNFDPTKYDLSKLPLTVMDKYALSRLNSAVRDTDRYLSEYKIPEAAKALFDYVDELSNWYVRRCRERFWVTGMPDDKAAAYMTLYTCLVTIAKASAPMIPFMTEDIYQNLVRTVDASAPESIHLCTFPECDETMIDAELESSMKTVVDVVVLGRSARNGSNIKNRQPLSAMYVCSDAELDEFFTDIIRDELNVKSVSFVKDASELSTYEFKPQLRTVGPKYGKFLGQIRAALDPANLDGNAAKRELDENGKLTFTFGADTVELTEEDLLISIAQKEGFFCVEDHGITVALDTTLTPELIDEGFVRELISKIQTMRKDSDFVVTDKITIYADAGEKITEIVGKYSDKILPAVLGREIILTHDLPEDAKEWDINGENVRLHLVR
ncbi:MAG: isoleucine--tRNA ligase [Clostridia bacterium]|nr:isoleucine--tRNA ligase [Clostridia bacterium]